jgi:uncharacterized membrane protein
MTRWLIVAAVTTLGVAAGCLYVGLVQPEMLRDRIPTHWNLSMVPDAWTTREHYYKYLLLCPAVMAFLTGLMWLLPRISPAHFRIEPFADTFGYCLTVIVGFFGYLAGLLVWVGIADSPLWMQFFLAGFFGLFALLGNVMGKVRQNYWMGVRPPLTLARAPVWDRTHRLAAWLWVAAGVVGMLLVLAGVPFWIALLELMVALFWPAVYSLLLYKRLERQGKI